MERELVFNNINELLSEVDDHIVVHFFFPNEHVYTFMYNNHLLNKLTPDELEFLLTDRTLYLRIQELHPHFNIESLRTALDSRIEVGNFKGNGTVGSPSGGTGDSGKRKHKRRSRKRKSIHTKVVHSFISFYV